MSSSPVTPQKTQEYSISNPDGRKIPVTKQLWEALNDFLANKRSGKIEIDCLNGGIAGVRGLRVYK